MCLHFGVTQLIFTIPGASDYQAWVMLAKTKHGELGSGSLSFHSRKSGICTCSHTKTTHNGGKEYLQKEFRELFESGSLRSYTI